MTEIKKSQLYLISPPQFELKSFAKQLEEALSTSYIPVFQLRIKNVSDEEILNIGKNLIAICHKYKTLFILNDRFDLALKIGADGVHIGGEDGSIADIRKKAPANFIIGASCYDSKHIAMTAGEAGADYISFGTFFPSKTKNSIGKPNVELLEWANLYTSLPIVAIGGINDKNCTKLIKNGADFLAIISYIWQNEKGVKHAIKSILKTINDL